MKKIYIMLAAILLLMYFAENALGQAASDSYKLTTGSSIGGGGYSVSDGYRITGAVLCTPGGSSNNSSYVVAGGVVAAEAAGVSANYDGLPVDIIPIADQTLTVTYEGVQTASGTFHYRPGGQISYQSASMTPGSGTLTYNLPASLLTLRGLEYYFTVDFGTIIGTIGAPDDPYVFMVDVTNAQGQRPQAMPEARYRIVGVPINTGTQHNPEAIFGDDLGAYDKTVWRLGRYLSAQGGNVEYPNVTDVHPARGYWLIARGGKTYGAAGTTVIPNFLHNNIPYYRSTFVLDTGWNQLANPYPFDVNWNEILFQDGAAVQVGHPAAVLDDAAWWYSNNGYINVTTIPGWDGFFVHINKAGIRILFPYHEVGTSKIVPEKLQSEIASDNWTVNLRLEANGLIDGYNQVGVRPDALPGTDRYDHFEPPPPPGGASLAFKFEDGGLKCTDFRPPFNDGAVWDVHISDCENATLTVSGLGDIPDDMQSWLKIGQGTIIRLSENVPVSLQSGSAKLIIGTEAYLAGENADLLPLKFALEQNYPNPFNPMTNLPYSLPAPGQVKLELFNVLGQKVRTLVDDMMPAGKYTVTWDSRDDNGYEVASGIYFYRIEYGDLVKQRKMVLLK